ncbi:UDP-3-O-(3-hydroxymyristoyl)glucosamine N-acyltransferase [Vibrio sp. UCD-FRSSP16_10]|uniref:UDP-3-O-(3-hydroxymyristoyl)glucosamine N-acyltransferase n=1 Tax=unclassified Vibrio TaxID=2614977 RepID=UPI0007FFC9EB|nr:MULTISPECIES: UDP-3-O-(3-hydroxymyristoyl)glucosamine N-acyltransferase [unclassified Vibrio]OBT16885.1 UDP-3-O-(3-hydroxymyristoyl)glucosamine N-acyltransferase [Vibrio sp. UCD-FRSSP16_30]OBT21873.1 UDP-3-O-(3-hydroxymyristoyl)glucosamine N-acyltransferase [Vibrio sp. UCD-FRSSP16_10]
MTELTLQQLESITGGTLHGDPETRVSSVAAMDKAIEGQITFLSNPRYKKQLAECKASVVMVKESERELCTGNTLVVPDPYVAYAKVAQAFNTPELPAQDIAPSAFIAEDATLGANVSVGPNATIESGAVLGDNVSIGAGAYVGKNAVIGAGTQLWANATLYHHVQVGERCVFHSSSVIGADGFGYANERGEWIKIPQVGIVKIGDRVEVGASTTIDRGALDDTIIESNVILDNQIQIGHNVHISYGSCIAGGTVVGGSTHIGKYCIIGGGAAISGHLEIADGSMISGRAMILKSITEKGVYSSGMPAQPNREWRKSVARLNRLEDMLNRLNELEKKIAS